MDCKNCEKLKDATCLTPEDCHSCNNKEITRLSKELYLIMLSEGVTHIDFSDGAVLTLTYKEK